MSKLFGRDEAGRGSARTQPSRRGRAAVVVGVLVLGAACSSREGAEGGFGPARTYEPVGRTIRWKATDAERFRTSPQAFSGAGGQMGSGAAGAADDSEGGLTYAVPPGWSELPKSQFREANFRVAGNPDAECYLSSLGGDGGGLEANVNRWRTQMSLGPLSADEIAALPRVPWFTKQAVRTDFTGTFKGMSGDRNAESWRLVGLLLVEPEGSLFLKMTGPAAVLEQELAHFDALAASFRFGAPDGAANGGMDAAVAGGGDLPDGHPPIGSGGSSTGAADNGAGAGAAAPGVLAGNRSASGYHWTPAAGWRRGPEKTMREITYLVGENDAAECYVTLLGGAGGGVLANVNRWCGQMGQAPLTEKDLEKLQRVPMLGGEATIVALERGATASSAPEHLLGAVLLLPERSLFVKFTGPKALLESERAAFLEFCRSVRPGE